MVSRGSIPLSPRFDFGECSFLGEAPFNRNLKIRELGGVATTS